MIWNFRIYLSGMVLLFAFSISVLAQDLGSTNGLFRASNPKSKKTTTEKKTNPKPKTTKPAPKKTTVRKNNSSRNRSENTQAKKTEPVKKQTTAKKTQPPNNIVITVGKQTSGSFNQLYEEAIEEGNIARDSREYAKAETAYRRARSLSPTDSRAVYGLGNLYSDQQRWEEAETYYREAIKLEPENPDPYIAISFVLTQPIIGKELSGRYIEAEKSVRKAIELDPENPFAYDQLGVALELNGKIGNETRGAYLKAIQIEPKFALAYAHLGRLLRRVGKIEESNAAYSKAISFSGDVPTMILVADVLQSQQRYADSEQLLRRALREDPKNPTALYLLGRALTTRGAYAEAESILKKSVEISPNSFVSYVLLGSLYSRSGDFGFAEKTLNDALKVISENEKKNLAHAFETVGDGYLKNGKRTDALRAYRQAIALDNQKESLIKKLARVQM